VGIAEAIGGFANCQLEQQGEAIGIFEAEGGFWKHRLRPSGDDILLKSYTGESFGSDTKTQGSVFLRAPVVAICTLVQPNVLEALYRDADLVEHGLVPRMLPILAPSQIPYSFQTEVPNELMIWFRSHVRSLLEIERPQGDVDERTFHTLTLTPEAKAEFDLFSQEVGRQMAAGMFEGYQAFGSKLAGHAVRLAGAMHLLKHGSPHHHEIDRDSMISGIALAEFFRQHAKVAFDPCARNGVLYAQKILAWIQRSRPAQFTEREAHRHACSRANIDQVRAGLDELERHNFIWRYVTGKSPICVVHPHAYGYIG
jgi:hypothetical protein